MSDAMAKGHKQVFGFESKRKGGFMKFTNGWISNGEIEKDIVVKFKMRPADIAVGGGLLAVGIGYLVWAGFKAGAIEFDNAQYDLMKELGIIKD